MKENFFKKMVSLALPIALQQLLVSCAQIVDTAMVVKLGNIEVSAVGVASRWIFLLNIVLFGISSGSSALIAQFWGNKDKRNIRRSYGFGLILGISVGILFSLAATLIPETLMRVFTTDEPVIQAGISYIRIVGLIGIFSAYNQLTCTVLRSTEDVTTPLFSSIISVLANTVLNYILIFGKLGAPALGLRGAAIATLLATVLQSVIITVAAIVRKRIIRAPIPEFFRLDQEFAARFLRVCMPVILNETAWAVGTNVYSMVFARQGVENYAGYTVFSSLEQIAFVFFVGICHACSIMVGKSIGEGKPDVAQSTAKKFLAMTPVLGIICGVIIIFVRNPLLSLMDIETQAAFDVASKLLFVYACWLPFRNIPYILIVGTFRAGGDVNIGIFIDIGSLYAVSIPVVCYLGLVKRVDFILLIAAMYLAEDLIKCIACLIRFSGKKWIKNLVYDMKETSA